MYTRGIRGAITVTEDSPKAIEDATGQYGRFDDAVKKIDPRSE